MDGSAPRNAADLLTSAAARPNAAGTTAVHWVDRDRSLSFAGALDAMARAAAVLSGFGVGPGGRVGLFAHPGLDYVVALLGAWRLGATAVLVDLAGKDRFHELMVAASPDAVVYTNDHFDYVRPTGPPLARLSSPAWTGLRTARSAGWTLWRALSLSPTRPGRSTPALTIGRSPPQTPPPDATAPNAATAPDATAPNDADPAGTTAVHWAWTVTGRSASPGRSMLHGSVPRY